MIILSVTHFGFHLNYKWVLVTGGTAGGTAIFLEMLLIVVRPYNFEKMTITDRILLGDGPDPMKLVALILILILILIY
jgi:hypothetical protein